MTKELKQELIRYGVSSLVTFVSSFLGALALFLDSVESYSELSVKSALAASAFVAFRVLVKYIAELLPKFKN